MNNSLIVCLLFFVSFFSCNALTDDKYGKEIWVYDKVSDVDVFEKHNEDMIKHLSEMYKQVIIDVNEKKLSINNNFLENSHVCTIDYVKLKKTPVSYFLSQKAVDMYKQIFNREGIQFSKDINV
ncbi:hypothetical protein [Buttiauxella noackiae]|uniref:hypothetical protein n=1 Tax=Buttiauxella noackiae TaxID=82992 RepID=UPI0005527823|nr:hypothetical protein [Buttiauxella noackiae]